MLKSVIGRAVIVPAIFLAGVGVILYLASLHAVIGNSDGATVVLEGQAIRDGHLALSGWSLSYDSFWSVDALFYAVATLFVGLRSDLLNVVPVVIAALVIGLGAWIARDEHRGWLAVPGIATVILVLGLPGPALSYFFLQGPLHVGTTLFALVAFVLLTRGHEVTSLVTSAIVLAAGILGDFQILFLGVAPVFVFGLVAAARSRNWRAGTRFVGAALLSVALAAAFRAVALAFGTYSVGQRNPAADFAQIGHNLHDLPRRIAGLFDIGTLPPVTAVSAAPVVEVAHALVLVVVLASVLVLLFGLVNGALTGTSDPGHSRLDDLLVLGVVADLVLFVTLSQTSDGSYTRYLTAGVIFGAIASGRLVGRLVRPLRQHWSFIPTALFGIAITVCIAVGFASSLSTPRPTQPALTLARFLEAHGLRRGIGAYWSSSIVTVESGGAVEVRPVIANANGQLVRYDRQSDKAWYSSKTTNFLVFLVHQPWGGVSATSAVATFGRATQTYFVSGYEVLVFGHDLAL